MEILKYFKEAIFFSKFSEFSIKLLTSMSIFILTVFFTPNFNIISFPILLLSSITIITIDSLINTIIGTEEIKFGKGMIGFSVATIIIYITQFFVEGYYISVISTIIAASIYGIIISMEV